MFDLLDLVVSKLWLFALLAGFYLQLFFKVKEKRATLVLFAASVLLSFVLPGLVFFIALFAVALFGKEILEVLSEQLLLQASLVFLYVSLVVYGSVGLLFIGSLFLSVSLFLCFTQYRPPFAVKLVLYVWFLAVNLAVIFAFANPFELEPVLAASDLFSAFSYGFVYLMALTMIFHLVLLLPLGKNQTWEEAIRRAKEIAKLMVGKYSDVDAGAKIGLLVLLVQGGLLLANYLFNIVEPSLMVAASFFVSYNFGRVFSSPVQVSQRPAL